MPSPLRFVSVAAVAAAGLLGLSSTAVALDAPTGLASTPLSPNKATDWVFTWVGPPAVDAGNTFLDFQGGIVDLPTSEPQATILSGASVPVPTAGVQYFRVRTRQTDDLTNVVTESAWTTLEINADRTLPTLGAVLQGTPINGWYGGTPATGGKRTLTILRDPCTDDSGLFQAPGCASIDWTQEGVFANQPVSVTDFAGNTQTVAAPSFQYDATRPLTSAAGGTAPVAPGSLVAAEPTFEWTHGVDLLSQADRYQLVFSTDADFGDEYNPGGGQVIANRDDIGGTGNYTATRDENLRPTSLPENVALKWWVRSIDTAGNVRLSSAFDLKIDPTVPSAPSITGGPNAPTQDTGPTFTWQGSESQFHWELTSLGSQQPIRQGGGSATQTTLAALPDGDYVFRLTQITAAGQSSAEAVRSFKVDTTPPAAPAITARPTFPSIGATPTFSWAIEPGAFSRWTVLSATGVVVGPIETPVTSAELPQLAEGPYTFQVSQIDAAGNVSPVTSESFTVIAPLVAPTPAQNARTAFLAALPKQNALRLQPKAGTTLPTLRPLLRWKKGPRGTKLYNLQVFQVTPRKGSAKPKVTKVLSRFPRGRQFRPPLRNLKPNTCYVWRVWPYTGTAFTARPVGVSNFCTAGPKVLRAKAARAAATRTAAKSRR